MPVIPWPTMTQQPRRSCYSVKVRSATWHCLFPPSIVLGETGNSGEHWKEGSTFAPALGLKGASVHQLPERCPYSWAGKWSKSLSFFACYCSDPNYSSTFWEMKQRCLAYRQQFSKNGWPSLTSSMEVNLRVLWKIWYFFNYFPKITMAISLARHKLQNGISAWISEFPCLWTTSIMCEFIWRRGPLALKGI